MAARSILVGVSGGCGSGKSDLVSAIKERLENKGLLPIQTFGIDAYQKRPIDGVLDDPSIFDFECLSRDLTLLKGGREVRLPRSVSDREERYIVAAPVIIVEGIVLFADTGVRNILDLRVFVDTAADLRFIRKLRREAKQPGDVGALIRQYCDSIRPNHLAHVEIGRFYADFIVNNDLDLFESRSPADAKRLVHKEIILTGIETAIFGLEPG